MVRKHSEKGWGGMKKNIIKIGVTILILWIIGLLWCTLELLFYGQITHRIVDDIVLLMFIPFIWNSISVDIGKKV